MKTLVQYNGLGPDKFSILVIDVGNGEELLDDDVLLIEDFK